MPLMTLRTVHLAILGGGVCFLLIVLALVGQPVTDLSKLTSSLAGLILLVVAAAEAIAAAVCQVIFPSVLHARIVRGPWSQPQDLAPRVARLYVTYVIVSTAMAEGSLLLAAIALLFTKHVLAIVVAVFAIAIAIAAFPTEARAVRFARRVVGKDVDL